MDLIEMYSTSNKYIIVLHNGPILRDLIKTRKYWIKKKTSNWAKRTLRLDALLNYVNTLP